MTSTTDLATGSVLAGLRRSRAAALAAELEVFTGALEWCRLHEVTDQWQAATWRETGQTLGGEGTPMVAEFSVVEFGAALGMSTDSARAYLAQTLELAHRLPATFARTLAGEVPVWRARRIAEHTLSLSVEAARYVDAHIAPFAHKSGPAATDRLVEEAILRFMPGLAAQLAAQAADGRYVRISHDHATGAGVSTIEGTLDYADAHDLDHALRESAAALKASGSEASLDVRRSIALGILARGDTMLTLDQHTDGDPELAEGPTPSADGPFYTRDLTFYLHLAAGDPSLITVENGRQVITPDTLTRWCDTGNARVVIKPVIDLNTPLSTSAYEVPDKIREHVTLRNPTCVFPHCTRPSRYTDLDHIEPYDENGPPGQTSTGNLAPLCRRHHRAKTFGDWTYTMLEPGVFLWRSPHGYTFQVDRTGTTDLTPPAVGTPKPPEPPDE